MKIGFAGDVMLGRLVADVMRQQGATYPLEPVAQLLSSCDITIINLECAITDSTQRFTGAHKAFYFGAPSIATDCLLNAGVDMVSLANNHILDFDLQGMEDTLSNLKAANIAYCGAGENSTQAHAPAYVEKNNFKVAMLSYCDHQADFEAGPSRPGMAYLDMRDPQAAFATIAADFKQCADANWPILALHWGGNWDLEPSPLFQDFAHACIDLGFKTIFGHSAHVFQGIEIYKGAPILYACGDFVDDYAIDPIEQNDKGAFYVCNIENNQLIDIEITPIHIKNFQSTLADQQATDWIYQRMSSRCQTLGSNLEKQDRKFLIKA